MVRHPTTGTSRRPLDEPLKRLFGTIKRLFAQVRSGFPGSVSGHANEGKDYQLLSMADKRQNRRIPLAGTTVHVTDGCLFATALIDNISLRGICLCSLPEQLYRSARQLTVFSSDNPGIPILHIQPKWQTTNWHGKTIGATILNTSEAWRLFFLHSANRSGL